MTDLERDLASLLNNYNQENASNTPDFILAQYILGCLHVFGVAVQQRENWYRRDPRPTSALADSCSCDPKSQAFHEQRCNGAVNG